MTLTACACCGAEAPSPCFTATAQSGERFDFLQCKRCGTVCHAVPPDGETLARAYGAEYYGGTRRKFIGPIASLVEYFQGGRARLVSRHIPAGRRVLDVGCGNGGYLAQMAGRGFAAEGTEWTAESASRVAEGISVHVGDLTTMNLPGSYEAISAWHVFEHLADPGATLDKMRELLSPTGRLFLSMPNQASWQARLFGPHWFHLDPPRHLYNFGRAGLKGMLERHGFEVLESHTWSLEQNPYGWIQSALNAAGRPREEAYSVLKGTANVSMPRRGANIAAVALLAGPALLASLLESCCGAGGTMTFVARAKLR